MSSTIQQILQRCQDDVDLTNNQTKNILLRLTNLLGQHLSSHENFNVSKSDKRIESGSYLCISEEIGKISDQMQKQIHILNAKIQKNYTEIMNKSEKILKQIDPIIQQNANQSKKFKEEMEDLQVIIGKKINKQLAFYEQKLAKILHKEMRSLKQLIQIQQRRLLSIIGELDKHKLQDKRSKSMIVDSLSSISTNQSVIQSPKAIVASQWVDPQCFNFKSKTLLFKQNVIACTSRSLVFGKQKLSGSCSFFIVLSKIKNIAGLGIIDSSYRTKDNLTNLPNKVWYFSDGDCVVGSQRKENQGKRYRMGEKVQVCVNLNEGKVEWKVGGEVRHSVEYEKLKDNSISYVPFINMWSKDDNIKIQVE